MKNMKQALAQLISSNNLEEKNRDQRAAERDAVITFARGKKYNLARFLAALTKEVKNWPTNKQGEKCALGSVTPMHCKDFRKTNEFKAINRFASYVVYAYDVTTLEKKRKPVVLAIEKTEDLMQVTIPMLKKKAAARGIILTKNKKADAVAEYQAKVALKTPVAVKPDITIVLAKAINNLKTRISKRRFEKNTKDRVVTLLAQAVLLLRDSPIQH